MRWVCARRYAVAAFLALCPLPAQAQAPEAVALVLEVAGNTSPAIAAFSELRAGSKVALGPEARLRFVHYKSCRMTRVRGGELTFLPSGHLLRDGTTESDELRTCPKRLGAGAQSGVAGGLVMRGGDAATIQLSPQPALMIAGARSARFARVVIEGPGAQVSLQRTLAAPVWRYEGPLLPPGGYRLVAFAADGRKLVDEAVSIAASDSAAPEIAILRAD
jgi:hypothetical protein